MPELPELETIVRGLRPRLGGRRVERVWLRHKTLYRRGSRRLPWLVGRTIVRVERVGKNALFRFEPAGLMVVNLGMTGRLLLAGRGERILDAFPKHQHARLQLDDGSELRYYDARRFGHFYVAESCDFFTDLNIGRDPFVADVDYVKARLRGRKAPIKSLLLDQRILSGIGNIYADELLFAAAIHPRTPGDAVVRHAARLLTSARDVLERAIEHGGSTVRDYRRDDGSKGEFQNHHAVYGREGDTCDECGTEIVRVVLGGRGTHYCPNCQR